MVTAVLAVVCVRLFFAMILVIPAEGERPALYAGDRVWVSRLAYGVRLPLSGWWGYRRVGTSAVSENDWVAFNNPAAGTGVPLERCEVFVGRCLGMPGDTLWFGVDGRPSRRRDGIRDDAWPVVVPAKGQKVKIEPWSARLYGQAVNGHERVKAAVIDDSLCVDGRMVSCYCFGQDFYWMSSSSDSVQAMDSRTFGFVPATHLIGRLTCVLYSLDPGVPWYESFRTDRVGILLPVAD